jgi:hypothetical protein
VAALEGEQALLDRGEVGKVVGRQHLTLGVSTAPPRSYSCSTRSGRLVAAGRVGWQRQCAWMLVFSSAQTT